MLTLNARHESHALVAPFRIARGVKTAADVVVVEITDGQHTGLGEAVPYARYGETIESVLAQIEAITGGLTDRTLLQSALPAGAARNALDCALWDLEARQKGQSIFSNSHGLSFTTAMTVGIDTPDAMAREARKYCDYGLLKIKLDDEQVIERLTAVRSVAPNPKLIVDPNESWSIDLLRTLDSDLKRLGVDLLEQPLAADDDFALDSFDCSVPICADESFHTSDDLSDLKNRYDAVNIKLDKSGGLTQALAAKKDAEAMGFTIMVGCMVATSLAIIPAIMLADGAAFLDLDGPAWIKKDRDNGLIMQNGTLKLPSMPLWGGP